MTPPARAGAAAGAAAATEGGLVVAYSLQPPYDLVQQFGVPGPATALAWHPRINQLLVGSGERSKGWTHVLYNPDMSEKGALLCAAKKPRQRNPNDYEPPVVIHNPSSLPMFRDDSWRKRRRDPDGGVRSALSPARACQCVLGTPRGALAFTTEPNLARNVPQRRAAKLLPVHLQRHPLSFR